MEDVVFELFKSTVALFVIVDPVGVLPFVASITKELGKQQRMRVINQSVLVGTTLLLLFSVGGHGILSLLGIEVGSFAVAGGLLLLVLAFRILVQGGEGWQARSSSLGVFPLAFPLLAGPGAITTVIFSINSLGVPYSLIPVVVVMASTWLVLRSIDWLLAVIGEGGADAVARIMSVFIAAIGVQYVVTGLANIITD
ncbi:MAG: MarC family protein [Candidatus Caldarchaeum sp.]|nr:MarC family protein [Candidatus Caldarchaeum sp.]MCS7137607.1 MarC family protein [Candidatus Caldarchaeum sp.]MDW7978055.1 MarC family protein [Candidatus Caldarchaeum sp.]MDW8359175.1 MarC family protein [Candidatus Caldarchaeum sp.]